MTSREINKAMATHCIFIGAPGAGKGTMAELMVANFGLAHISTGDLLRAEIKSGTQRGLEAKAYMDRGALVPDELVANMVKNRLGEADVRSHGFLLDGYPRTVNQAGLLADVLQALGFPLDIVLLLEVEREVLLARLTSRRLCRGCSAIYNVITQKPQRDGVCDQCGGELYQRSDDTMETALNRLSVYEQLTAPLIELYEAQGKLIRVHGGGTREQNFSAIRNALGR